MKIILSAAEVAPFVKVGGLADVSGSLPQFIKEAGHDIRLILPLYGPVQEKVLSLEKVPNSNIELKFGTKLINVALKQAFLPDTDILVYFIENNEYFGSHNEIYPQKKHARFEQERFLVFGLSVLKLMEKINFKPDIIHCNDWHTANIPVYLKTIFKSSEFYKETKILFSIHNLAYQGLYSKDILEFANLDQYNLFTPDKLEFYNDVNWMKGGIVYSDAVNTVSEKYTKEIQTPEYGEKLDGLLREKSYKISGILNGIDCKKWNPETDNLIPEKYSKTNLTGKKVCKKFLQQEFKLEESNTTPLIGIVSRLAPQKGLDLIQAISDDLKHLNMQLVVLGSGEEEFEILFKDLNLTSKNIRSVIGFNSDLAQKIYAGIDLFLMPSKFEPCGLGQIISLRYGTLPIVRKTGGLSDTIKDFSLESTDGNGFVFEEYDANKLLETVKKAIEIYKNKNLFNKAILNAMNSDFSWNKSAKKYIELYEKIRVATTHPKFTFD